MRASRSTAVVALLTMPSGAFTPLESPSVHQVVQVASSERWEAVDALPAGEQIVLALKDGVFLEGAFKRSSSLDLVLIDPAGIEHAVAKSDVRRVVRKTKDSSVDGLLLGVAVGAGLGVLIGYGRRTFETPLEPAARLRLALR